MPLRPILLLAPRILAARPRGRRIGANGRATTIASRAFDSDVSTSGPGFSADERDPYKVCFHSIPAHPY